MTLRHTPRAAGSARYILRLGEEADTFSVIVAVPHPPATMLLASAPDRDWSDLRDWLTRAVLNPVDWEPRLVPDEQATISPWA